MKNSMFVHKHLPRHFREYYPKFVRFIEEYYEWLGRNRNFTNEERLRFNAGQSELVRYDPSEFEATGQTRLVGEHIQHLDGEVAYYRSPDWFDDNFLELTNLERLIEHIETNDEDIFCTSDDEAFSGNYVHNGLLDNWFADAGFSSARSYSGDVVLFGRILRSLYQVKGTSLALKMFFNLFFNEEVEVLNPNLYIAILDDTFIPDSLVSLSDDEDYQEFSIIVNTEEGREYYEPLFTDIYIKMFHPAGFKIKLSEQNPSLERGTPRVSFPQDTNHDGSLAVSENNDTKVDVQITIPSSVKVGATYRVTGLRIDGGSVMGVVTQTNKNDGYIILDSNKIAVGNIIDVNAYIVGAKTGIGKLFITDSPDPNQPPVAVNDNYTMEQGQTITLNPLNGDSDPDGDSLVITGINGTQLTPGTAQQISVNNGVVNITSSGIISFTPTPTFHGTVGFSYSISDGKGGTALANQVITVTELPIDPDSPVSIEDFDFAVIRYIWTAEQGKDLDTRTYIKDPDRKSGTVGWSRLSNDETYLRWGGDNTANGVECILLDIKQFGVDFPAENIVTISCNAFWYSVRETGDLAIQFETYKGGTMTQSGYDFVNSGGTLKQSVTIQTNTASLGGGAANDGQELAILTYNQATDTGSLVKVV